MNSFFSGLVTIGICLIIVSIVMVMLDRKRDLDEKNEIVSLKNELRELLEDSSDMVDELNRFSDYIVNKVDEKCSEFNKIMSDSNVTIKPLNEEVSKAKSVQDNSEHVYKTVEELEKSEFLDDEIAFSDEIQPISPKPEESTTSKNQKHDEVMKLFEAGMTDSDIAKALNMGKGEVQLIVGLNLHKIKV